MGRKYMAPEEIEQKSMEIIERELTDLHCSFEEKEIIKRVIHTTVDFDFGKSIIFHPTAIEAGLSAIREGKNIITDVQMVKAGIRSHELEQFGNNVLCFIEKGKNEREGNKEPIPRAVIGIRQAVPYLKESIVVIGNAPTALFEVLDLVQAGCVAPSLIIGIPVGFVGAAEAKSALRETSITYFSNKGLSTGNNWPPPRR